MQTPAVQDIVNVIWIATLLQLKNWWRAGHRQRSQF